MKFATRSVLSCFCFLVVIQNGNQFAEAHPGHGIDGGSHEMSHYFTEPTHLAIWIVAIALVAVLSLRMMISRRKPISIKSQFGNLRRENRYNK